jgi:hypothetical protein
MVRYIQQQVEFPADVHMLKGVLNYAALEFMGRNSSFENTCYR